MKNERIVTLNDKGVLLFGILILSLTFTLGFMVSSKREEKNVTIFTEEDLDRITELKNMENERGSRAEIYAYKDKDGHLMIGWDYGN